MNIDLTGHHVEVTPALREYVDTRLAKLERHFDHVTQVHVILTVEKTRHKAEATVNISGARLFADTVDDNMYTAIDALSQKLDTQIRKHKEKLTDHHRDRRRVGDLPPQEDT